MYFDVYAYEYIFRHKKMMFREVVELALIAQEDHMIINIPQDNNF